MSLFGSLMRDMERDPIFGAHHRAMNRMMNSFLGGGMPGMAPGGFGLSLMGPGPMMQHQQHNQHEEYDDLMPFGGGMMNPFGAFGGFPNMGMQMMTMDPGNGHHAFSSSSFMSISSGPDGRPQVYQASSELRQGPDGLKETRKTLQDSRSGVKKMAVGRHMNERGHVVEREQNMRTGQMNEVHEFYNLEEQEAPTFDREWRNRANGVGIGYSHSPSFPAITSTPHVAVSSGTSPHSSSYADPNVVVTETDEYDGVPDDHTAPHHSYHSQPSSSVTIEELPASDDEAEQLQQQARTTSRRAYPVPSSSSAAAAATSARRSPYETSKEKRQKRAKSGKKSRR